MDRYLVTPKPGTYVGYAGLVIWVIGTEISERVPCQYDVFFGEGGDLRFRPHAGILIRAREGGLAVTRIFVRRNGPHWVFDTETPHLFEPNNVIRFV